MTASITDEFKIGSTGVKVSSLGLGCASLAGIFEPVPELVARDTINTALDRGITYFDTAPFYGHGLSERLVGDQLRGRSGHVLSSKVGRLLQPGKADDPGAWVSALPFSPVYDYSYDGVMRSYEASLHRLGVDHIDILYIHDIGEFTHGAVAGPGIFEKAMDGGYKALDQLRSSGAISAIGLGVNEIEVCQEALSHGDWDVFLLAGRYTLLEQDPLENLFSVCTRKNTDIVIGGPFNSGVLAGGGTFDYSEIPRHIAEKVELINKICAAHAVPVPAAALQFPIAHPIVKSVIPGPRTPDELMEILKWWSWNIPQSLWTDLKTEHLLHPDAPTPMKDT